MPASKKRRLTFPKQSSQDLVDDLKGLLFDETTADVILKVQDERLPAHRAVLAVRCAYFRAMLYGGMQESAAKEVQVHDSFSPAVMRLLLRYIYTQQLEPMALEDVVPLLACADHVGMDKLRDAVLHQIAESLSLDTVWDVLSAAVENSQELLAERCIDFVRDNALEVLMSDSFVQLDAPLALRVLRADSMQNISLLCFKAATRWQAHWTRLFTEGSEGRKAEEAMQHLSPADGEMRQYLDAATVQLLDRLCSIELSRSGEVAPATIVRRCRADTQRKHETVIVKPTTARTRFKVHGPYSGKGGSKGSKMGPVLVIWDPDVRKLPSSFVIGLDATGFYTCEGERSKRCSWVQGNIMLDVVISTAASGDQEVSVLHGEVKLAQLTKPRIELSLGFRDSDYEVSIESLS